MMVRVRVGGGARSLASLGPHAGVVAAAQGWASRQQARPNQNARMPCLGSMQQRYRGVLTP
jgi:hypothetical protein